MNEMKRKANIGIKELNNTMTRIQSLSYTKSSYNSIRIMQLKKGYIKHRPINILKYAQAHP